MIEVREAGSWGFPETCCVLEMVTKIFGVTFDVISTTPTHSRFTCILSTWDLLFTPKRNLVASELRNIVQGSALSQPSEKSLNCTKKKKRERIRWRPQVLFVTHRSQTVGFPRES